VEFHHSRQQNVTSSPKPEQRHPASITPTTPGSSLLVFAFTLATARSLHADVLHGLGRTAEADAMRRMQRTGDPTEIRRMMLGLSPPAA
jgi:hypothetical protein